MKSNHSICMRKAGKRIFGKVRFSGNWKKVESKKNGKVLYSYLFTDELLGS